MLFGPALTVLLLKTARADVGASASAAVSALCCRCCSGHETPLTTALATVVVPLDAAGATRPAAPEQATAEGDGASSAMLTPATAATTTSAAPAATTAATTAASTAATTAATTAALATAAASGTVGSSSSSSSSRVAFEGGGERNLALGRQLRAHRLRLRAASRDEPRWQGGSAHLRARVGERVAVAEAEAVGSMAADGGGGGRGGRGRGTLLRTSLLSAATEPPDWLGGLRGPGGAPPSTRAELLASLLASDPVLATALSRRARATLGGTAGAAAPPPPSPPLQLGAEGPPPSPRRSRSLRELGGGDATTCHICGGRCYRAERREDRGRSYHHDCFRCHTCRYPLNMDFEHVRADQASGGGEHLYCLPHAAQMRMRNPQQQLFPVR